jgi:dTDP-4-dehydrorhamnose reductase
VRVAVSGAGGRLGRALVDALEEAPYTGPFGPISWRRPDYDLDDPSAAARVVARDRPEVVVHAAAWADVDACALDPRLAMRRNAEAAGEMAEACAGAGVDLVLISTNEVFAGDADPAIGYGAGDATGPLNPYGASKLAAEEAARAAFAVAGGLGAEAMDGPLAPDGEPASLPGGRVTGPQLAIARTAWLFGATGADFPSRILLAAERARSEGGEVALVADETGTPSYLADVAEAIVELLGAGVFAGTHHLVNSRPVTRAAWARETLALVGVDVPTRDVSQASFARESRPPRAAVLRPTPLPSGEPMRDHRLAMADYAPRLRRWFASAAGSLR